MKIVLASNNLGKLDELQMMFRPLGVQLLRQSDLGIGEAEDRKSTRLNSSHS